jgi:thymidylate synthase (FAD)
MNNTVELLGYYGSDTIHAQSAWTSTSRDLSEEKLNRIPKLLKMLADNGHETPFEKSSFHFLVNVEQATHIHLLKHRIGVSINGESARYKELKEDKFYLPEDFKIKLSENASVYGSFSERLGVSHDWYSVLENYTKIGNELYHQCLEDLTPVVGRKRAKESARFFKTFNSQISLDIMFNWRSFVHFYRLRADEGAQVEVRMLAQQMLELIKNIEGNPFKYTIESFGL